METNNYIYWDIEKNKKFLLCFTEIRRKAGKLYVFQRRIYCSETGGGNDLKWMEKNPN